MQFQVSGQYLNADVILYWEDGELTGEPIESVNIIKSMDENYAIELGGQLIIFELDDFEVSHLFITEILVENAIVTGDKPEVDTDRIY